MLLAVQAIAASHACAANLAGAELKTGVGQRNETKLRELQERRLAVPVAGVARRNLIDTYVERRGERAHEAIDIAAPLGTPVVAVDDGIVVKLFNSARGGGERRSTRFLCFARATDADAPAEKTMPAEAGTIEHGDAELRPTDAAAAPARLVSAHGRQARIVRPIRALRHVRMHAK